MPHFLVGLVFGLIANLIAEWFLQHDAPARPRNTIRVLRWLGITVGSMLVATNIPFIELIVFCLFTVSVATDFETKYLPPDSFTIGGAIAGISLEAWQRGVLGLRDVLVAQAVCFAVTVFAVALFKLCDSGDIKLAILFGVACGNLLIVIYGVIGTWIVAWLVVLWIIGLRSLQTRSIKTGLRYGLTLRPPLGPLLWVGLVAALIGQRIWISG